MLVQDLDDVVVVGIDFGTTYSGVAWAYSKQPEDIELVTSWDSEYNQCSDVEKCPTQLYYGDGKESVKWGYAIPADNEPIKWFKLLLLDEGDVPADVASSTQYKRALKLRQDLNKDPVELVSCFLRQIWNHAVNSIEDTIGAELLERCKFHIVITLPAIWPAYAQRRMRQAAKASGILEGRPCGNTTLRFISEPEAAALATLKDLSQRSNTKAGDTIVVCDAGGGTVDLISYVIETLSPFVVKECVKGDGELCGAVFLDERFLELVQTKAGPQVWRGLDQAQRAKFMNDNWEHGIKPQFRNQARVWSADLPRASGLIGSPGVSQNKMKRQMMTLELSPLDVLSVFLPIIGKIVSLVQRQVMAVREKYGEEPKYVILVGGFGRSQFLSDSLKTALCSSTTVLQSRGSKPWSAISRGAVVQGLATCNLSQTLSVKVEARIARASYGVLFCVPWNSEKYLEIDKVWSENEYAWKATNQMEWFLRQGDDITTTHPVRHSFHTILSSMPSKLSQQLQICSAFPPPSRRDASVWQLCTITWNQVVDFEKLPLWTNKLGKVFRKLKYDIEMTCEDGTVDFAIYFQGKRVGGRNVHVDFC
ncbi:Heat shock 70 kDa protein 12A [Paramyrothecium foliicola]|nr:Heat shock 70 kDa protein 12A [Paramyrothecium foliicola]